MAQLRQGGLNRSIRVRDLDEVAPLDADARAVLRRELESDRLSGRGYHRIRRVARTIADLRGAANESVSERDVARHSSCERAYGGRFVQDGRRDDRGGRVLRTSTRGVPRVARGFPQHDRQAAGVAPGAPRSVRSVRCGGRRGAPTAVDRIAARQGL